MGVTVDAIRKRISRGTIPHERDDDGRVWVLLDTDQDPASKVQDTDQPQSDATALISAKDETIAALREQLEQANERDRENRRIIAGLTARVPEIEPPRPPPDPTRIVRPEPHPPGLLQQVGATATTTLVGQAALAAFQAFSVLKGNIRLAIILGVGQALLLVGTLLYVRRQRRFPAIERVPGDMAEFGEEATLEPPASAPDSAPFAYRLILWSIITVALVFGVAIAFFQLYALPPSPSP
jgi:hypothetical protein